MIGAILGDIIGSTHEFVPIKTEHFELFPTNSTYTDDTVMTVATADALINGKPFEKAYLEWVNKYPGTGYGGKFKEWSKSENPQPYNSYGNGSAMRVSPIAWVCENFYNMINLSKESAECTHNHIEGIKGAQAVSRAIWMARKIRYKEGIREKISSIYGYNLDRTVEEIRKDYKFSATCQGSVPEALICFLDGSSFEDTVRKAVSLGGDSDTQASIAGAIAEAYYGIPKSLEIVIYDYIPNEMVDIIKEFKKIQRRK